MRKKGLIAAAVIGLAAVLLTACGGGGSSSDAGGGGGEVTLDFWLNTQQDTANATLDQAISDFEAANPNIKINMEQRAVDGHKDAMRTSAGTDAAPDIYFYWAGPGLGGDLVESGVSLDLAKYYQQYGWDERFPAGVLKNATQYGGYHGIPWTQKGEALYYNKDLFAQAGITTPPKTYDELVADAQKLKDAGITPISFGGTVNWHLMRLLDNIIETKCGSQTGDLLNHLEASWATTPCIQESFTELKKWTDNYVAEGFIGIDQTEAASAFHSGQVAMALEGDWFTQQIIDNGLDITTVGVFQFPTGTDRLYGFGENLYITASSQHPDEAAKFLDFMTSTEEQQKFSGVFGAVSVNKDVQPQEDAPEVGKQMAEFITTAPAFFLNNDQNFPLDVTTEYWRIQNAVATGEITPQDAGAQFQTFIDAHQ